MEKKKIPIKWLGIGAAGVVLIAAVVFLTLHLGKGKDTYRSIQIYDLEGSAIIEREGVGEVAAVENLFLESGDRILVSEESTMRLKLDDDKYILVEENSIFTIVAEGTKEDSKTSIILEKGAITNEIQNKLNDNSSYDVTTPNSVMAVRGTIFRVEVIIEENGEIYTKVSTFEGVVVSQKIAPDGTIEEDELSIEAGNEVIIYMDEKKTEYLAKPQKIDYKELPVQTLEFLKDKIEQGTNIAGITLEEIQELLSGEGADSGESSEAGGADEPDKNVKPEETNQPPKNSSSGETTQPTKNNNSGETGNSSGNGASGETGNSSDDNSGEADSTEEPVTPEQTICTVTFMYKGEVFGTQQVEKGKTVSVPKLSPAETGGWDFDFSKAIYEDTTINWK